MNAKFTIKKKNDSQKNKQNALKCKICNKECSTRALLSRHISNAHLKFKQFKCNQCEITVDRIDSIKRHLNTCCGNFPDQQWYYTESTANEDIKYRRIVNVEKGTIQYERADKKERASTQTSTSTSTPKSTSASTSLPVNVSTPKKSGKKRNIIFKSITPNKKLKMDIESSVVDDEDSTIKRILTKAATQTSTEIKKYIEMEIQEKTKRKPDIKCPSCEQEFKDNDEWNKEEHLIKCGSKMLSLSKKKYCTWCFRIFEDTNEEMKHITECYSNIAKKMQTTLNGRHCGLCMSTITNKDTLTEHTQFCLQKIIKKDPQYQWITCSQCKSTRTKIDHKKHLPECFVNFLAKNQDIWEDTIEIMRGHNDFIHMFNQEGSSEEEEEEEEGNINEEAEEYNEADEAGEGEEEETGEEEEKERNKETNNQNTTIKERNGNDSDSDGNTNVAVSTTTTNTTDKCTTEAIGNEDKDEEGEEKDEEEKK